MKNKICQSCGMPLKRDPQRGGTNADGSLSEKYCSYCYKDGAFIYPCEDVKLFQDKCKEIMVAHGHSKIVAWLFTRGMSRLERWKKK
ncbi:MAG: zinc ribbon domain-containing protein [Phocaeicola sp.]|nr:zinc ribbon domain-containing protein [Phocaeicola sp.]MDY3914494.1 zinc ribbon domain-containing protein [Phocaeicola sp.]